jgi:MFS transporter, NNP family, nitrate/nitrite transporter
MSAATPLQIPPRRTSAVDIVDWRPEDPVFWDTTGKRIAYRNLVISVPSLLCGFAVWLMWGIITVQMANLGFPFTQQQLFTLAAISGLSGATLRIPASFFIRIAGGRNTIWLTTALLMIPALGTGIALQDKSTPLWVFQLMALLSGIGGGNFACSMSNINTFFPEAAARHCTGHQRRARQLRCHDDADRDPAGDDHCRVHGPGRRSDDATEGPSAR